MNEVFAIVFFKTTDVSSSYSTFALFRAALSLKKKKTFAVILLLNVAAEFTALHAHPRFHRITLLLSILHLLLIKDEAEDPLHWKSHIAEQF